MADDVERCGQARLAQCGLAGGGDGGSVGLKTRRHEELWRSGAGKALILEKEPKTRRLCIY